MILYFRVLPADAARLERIRAGGFQTEDETTLMQGPGSQPGIFRGVMFKDGPSLIYAQTEGQTPAHVVTEIGIEVPEAVVSEFRIDYTGESFYLIPVGVINTFFKPKQGKT
ncbi:MAG TPA: hypothetical protein VNX28_15310 [Gemmataceae bacterium]|jgi:hypothetical protein|nr:hypothetical protein [Gemmataceae bacterium]